MRALAIHKDATTLITTLIRRQSNAAGCFFTDEWRVAWMGVEHFDCVAYNCLPYECLAMVIGCHSSAPSSAQMSDWPRSLKNLFDTRSIRHKSSEYTLACVVSPLSPPLTLDSGSVPMGVSTTPSVLRWQASWTKNILSWMTNDKARESGMNEGFNGS